MAIQVAALFAHFHVHYTRQLHKAIYSPALVHVMWCVFAGNTIDNCEGEYVCYQQLLFPVTICYALLTKLCKLCVHACVNVCVCIVCEGERERVIIATLFWKDIFTGRLCSSMHTYNYVTSKQSGIRPCGFYYHK